METGKSKICRMVQPAGDPGKSWFYSSSPSPDRIFSFLEVSLCSKYAFIWLDEATHIMENNLIYSKSTNLNVNLI